MYAVTNWVLVFETRKLINLNIKKLSQRTVLDTVYYTKERLFIQILINVGSVYEIKILRKHSFWLKLVHPAKRIVL